MKKEKLEETIGELRDKALLSGYRLSYDVMSGSMRLLISAGDTVELSKAGMDNIHKGDIIAWKQAQGVKRYPIMHRVIEKRRENGYPVFLTKGDWCDKNDNYWIHEHEIIGKVSCLIKGWGRIPIERGAGRIISIGIGALSSALKRSAVMLLTLAAIILYVKDMAQELARLCLFKMKKALHVQI